VHRFSTDDWPERDRLEAWREVVGRSVMCCEIDAVSGVPYYAEMTLSALPGLDINRGVAVGMEYRHTPALLGSPDLVLILSLTGAQVVRQRGREAAIGAGEGMLVSGAEPLLLTHRDAERFIALRLPRDVIAAINRSFRRRFGITPSARRTSRDAMDTPVTGGSGMVQGASGHPSRPARRRAGASG
jgi:hypothetical protein